MKRLFISLALWLSLASIALAHYVQVEPENRMFNKSGSQCVWCACETVCRTIGVQEGEGLVKKYFHATNLTYAEARLKERGIYCSAMSGSGTWEKIREHLVAGFPVVVTVPGHAIVVVGYDSDTKEVKIIDNGKNREVQTWSWERWRSRWDGGALFIRGSDSAAVPVMLLPRN